MPNPLDLHDYWLDSNVYIIGGGPSLCAFDWELLAGRRVIGVNSAVYLGARICPVLFFSDPEFLDEFEPAVNAYSGKMVTSTEKTIRDFPWLYRFKRSPEGLHTGDRLGFNFTSGAGAINLALTMGARRVLLLGCDCKPIGEVHHWHPKFIHNAPDPYPQFLIGYANVARHLPRVFPGREVINLNPDSAIPDFPKRPWQEFLNVKEVAV